MSLSDNMAECNLCITTRSKPFKWFFLTEETLLCHISCTIQYISKYCDSGVEATVSLSSQSKSVCVLGDPLNKETYTGFIARSESLILAQVFLNIASEEKNREQFFKS